MKKYRPVVSGLSVALCIMLLAAFVRRADERLGRTDALTGWSVAATCLILVALPLRKKLAARGLGRVAVWQQFHHFAGVFAIAAFLFHAGLAVAGALETALAVLFWWLALSGLGHWYFNRRIPMLLLTAGPPLRHAEVQPLRRMIAAEAYSAALAAATDYRSACLAEFYSARLARYFRRYRSIGYYLRPSGRQRRELQHQLVSMGRYVGGDNADAKDRLHDLIRRRDDVDFQAAMLLRLRLWNVLHVAAVQSFVLLAILHVLLAYQYGMH